MTTDNTQVGLKKWCEAFIDGDISAGQFKRAVRIWHNKQIEEVLGRLLEHGEDFTTFGDAGRSVAVEYIEAERNRLNKLKESS